MEMWLAHMSDMICMYWWLSILQEEARFKLEGGKMKDGEQYFPINDKDLTDSWLYVTS